MLRHTTLALALTLTFFLAAASRPATAAPRLLEDKPNVLFLGDSITQHGLYVALVEAYLWTAHPDAELTITNIGQSGETASGDNEPHGKRPRPYIHSRIDHILANVTPDLTFVCYGMNDGVYAPLSLERTNHYLGGIRMLVDKLHAAGSEVVLLTPPPFDAATRPAESLYDPGQSPVPGKLFRGYDDVLKHYGDLLQNRALTGADHVIDLGNPVRGWIKTSRQNDPAFRYGDSVHPPEAGHEQMALALLDGAGEDTARARQVFATLHRAGLVGPIADRHRARSNAFRTHCRTGSPTGAKKAALAAAIEKAAAEEAALRKRIANALSPAAAAPKPSPTTDQAEL